MSAVETRFIGTLFLRKSLSIRMQVTGELFHQGNKIQMRSLP
ncbi:MAG: hypothetical protein RM022_008445 [Nostoc sp. EfeVER01]|nr:hypothetical protein [Nostoc sp. EfeVER01]